MTPTPRFAPGKVYRRWLRPKLEFKWQDMWIGGYPEWQTIMDSPHCRVDILNIWICIIPCFPLHLRMQKEMYYFGRE